MKFEKIVLIGILFLGVVIGLTARPSVYATSGSENLSPASGDPSAIETIAQNVAMANREVADLLDGNRAEVFTIFSITEQFAHCAETKCLQANIYDYDANATISVVVDTVKEETIDLFYLEGVQPPIFNSRLDALAKEAIINSVDVREAIGFTPKAENIILMQANHADSPNCAGDHTCAAAVFIVDGGVVWVLYDGTEEQIDKIWWGDRPHGIAETDAFRATPDADFLAQVPLDCSTSIDVDQNGWTMTYETTSSDSLRVSDIRFNGNLVVTAASLVEWHADYGSSGFRDSTGCFNGGGGPHGFAIYPFGDTEVNDIMFGRTDIGFEIVQDFRMSNWGSGCNYRYEQRLEFFNDGSWRIKSAAYGKGCGSGTDDEAIYRPVWRMDLAVDDTGNDVMETWDGSAWQTESTEAWYLMDSSTQYSPEGYMFRMSDSVSGSAYFIQPGQGQFGDNGTGDNAYFYLTRYNAAEGATDISLLSGTGCCNDSEAQGPHVFVDGESTDGEDLVLWYVPQSETITTWMVDNGQGDAPYCWTQSTSEAYPCWSGPMFRPDIDPLAVGLDSANADQTSSSDYVLIVGVVALLVTLSGYALLKRQNA